MALINTAYHENQALNYYNTATRLLLDALQTDSRDTEKCATTAIILNVYEIMSERPSQRMNHIAGARALLKECGWNARTDGVGGACFWLNVTMEILSCLRFNWAVAWDPDEWGVDMNFNRPSEPGHEEIWAHRIIYILAKVVTFKASGIRSSESTSNQMYMTTDPQKRYEDEWQRLRDLCKLWHDSVPQNMFPLAYLESYQTRKKSAFPEVWILKRCAIIARLFYHTAMIILAAISPFQPGDLQDMALTHAHQVCGITAHVKDRGVASVALRSLHTAAEWLNDRREQEEVLEIFTKIKKETGWQVNFVYKELKEKWGWEKTPDAPLPQPSSLLQSANVHRNQNPATHYSQRQYHQQQQQYHHQDQQQQIQAQQHHQAVQTHPRPIRRHSQLVNPLMAATDLASLSPGHPYHPHYVSSPQVERHQFL